MNIDDLTIGQAKEVSGMFREKRSETKCFWEVGKAYLIRTVTHIDIGIVKAVGDKEILLSDCAWIADTGRYHQAIKDGELNEVEPYINDVILGRGAIIDSTEWTHTLPRDQK